MENQSGITYGVFDGFTWIRCEGKGSFLQSPPLKDCAHRRWERGETHFVIDLEGCTGMDSTFMGVLAGLASKVSRAKGWVHIADPGPRNRDSLEDLGLDCLLGIDPGDAPWRDRVDEIRGQLEPYAPKQLVDIRERARQVLEAHRDLAASSQENAARFASVLDVLEKQAGTSPDSDHP